MAARSVCHSCSITSCTSSAPAAGPRTLSPAWRYRSSSLARLLLSLSRQRLEGADHTEPVSAALGWETGPHSRSHRERDDSSSRGSAALGAHGKDSGRGQARHGSPEPSRPAEAEAHRGQRSGRGPPPHSPGGRSPSRTARPGPCSERGAAGAETPSPATAPRRCRGARREM